MSAVQEALREAARGRVGVDRRFVQSILDYGSAAPAEILAFARERADGQRLDITPLLVDLLRHWNAPESLDFLIEAVRTSEDRAEFLEALLPFGQRAVEPLLKLYEEAGEENGSDLAFLLAGMRVRDPRVLAALLERLEFDASDGAFCLGIYGDPAAIPALERMRAEIPQNDPDLRREISDAIENARAKEEPYQPEPFDVLTEYPERELPRFDVLPEAERLELFGSPDPEVRKEAAYSFFNAGVSESARRALFELAQSDPEPGVRGRAWESLSDAIDDPAIRTAMLAAAADERKSVEERGGAAVGLFGAAEDNDIRPVLEALYEEGGTARAKALESMWRSLSKPYARYFPAHLADPDPAILRQAIRGAGYFRLTACADKIATHFDEDEDSDADLREDALFAYALAMPGETTRGRARGMLRKIDSLAHLNPEETELVMFAIDERMRLHGLEPVFGAEADPAEEEPREAAEAPGKVGRNELCPCGSGKKYKKCCGK